MSDQASPLSTFDRVVSSVRHLVEGVRPDQWSDSTPCTEWNVGQLVDHLIEGNRRVASRVREEGGGPAGAPADSGAAADRAGAYRASTQSLREAFSPEGAMERTYNSPFGPIPGPALVQLRCTEELIHGWDLARATGQSTEGLPADLAEAALAGVRHQLGDRPREGLPFAPAQPVSEDAPAIDRLAAFCGRAVERG